MKPALGFTLIELMTTIAVLGVVLGIAVPGVRQLALDNRQSTQLNLFASTLAMARSEAIKQNTRVAVCPSSDRLTCASAGTGWQAGWIAYVDRNSDLIHTASTTGCNEGVSTLDCQLIAQGTLSGSSLLTGASGVPSLIGYDGSGAAFCDANQDRVPESCQSSTTYFTLCDTRGASSARGLSVSTTGRTSVIDKKPNGSALTCP